MRFMGMRRKSHIVIIHDLEVLMKIRDALADIIDDQDFEMDFMNQEDSRVIIERVFGSSTSSS